MESNTNKGWIKELFRYPEKKMPGVKESKVIVEKSMGILGDHHADGGERQISLVAVFEKEWMERQELKGFCFKKYKENILLDGIDLRKCHSGNLLKCGDAVLELTGEIKSCYPELCKLAEYKENCILAGSCRFAKVKVSGVIEAGMSVEIVSE